MKTKIYTLLLLLLTTVFCNNLLKAQTYNLHWGSTAWVGPTYAKTLTNIGGSGIGAQINITNSGSGGNSSAVGTSVDNNAFQNNSPIVGATGGINWFLPGSTGGNPLVQWVDWSTLTSTVTTVITFTRPVDNVSFYLGDMDRAATLSYVDRFTFTALNGTASVPNPIVTRFQASFTAPDTVLISGNSAFGNQALANGNSGTSSATTQGATIQVQFSNPVTKITLFWDQGPGATGNPAGQAVVIGDISFRKVIPEFPPTADNFLNAPIPQGNAATAIPALTAADLDGTVASYKIVTIPLATEGVLIFCSNGTEPCTGTVTSITANTVLTPAQMATLKFDPSPAFTGTAKFTFNATDNDGNISNTATYSLAVIALPPVSNNIMENSMPNTNGPTAIQGLNAADVDGTIANYTITTAPPVGEGVLTYCSNGTEPCTGTITTIAAGTVLTGAQMATLKFDPAPGFIGKSTFVYTATDNSGNTSNSANYTIPVSASATIARPPLADNIIAQTLNNSLGSTAIARLQASDLDGTVASYTISTIPTAGQGILYCCGGSAVTAGQVLAPAQAATLQFDPAPGFTGTASFSYFAIDNSGLTGNTATYNLPVINTPPTASNVNTFVPFNAGATTIPALSGSDADGTITGYTITTIPPPAQGILYCCGGTAVTAGQVLTPAQAATLQFDPATGFSGIAPFNFSTTDNNGNVSSAASYNITMAPQPPVTNDITNAVIANTAGSTVITSLIGTDADGTIASYTVLSVPDASQGILIVPCGTVPNPTPTGAVCVGGFASLTEAVLTLNPNGISLTTTQAAALRFDPAAGFTGLAAFKYDAIDNSGLMSNISTYTLPVSGTGNIPPVAKNVLAASMANTNGATAIPALVGTDADGTIASYALSSVPSASQGVLSVPCGTVPNPTPPGATCTGGFANLTAAVLTANPNGIALTPTQAAAMRFDPDPNFSGKVEFAYNTTDNSGAKSAGVVYTIPVTSIPPVANAVVAPAMSHNNVATLIPGLIASDADGTIANYTIENIPPAAQGILSYCSNGTEPCTGTVTTIIAGTVLTPAQMATLKFDPAVGYTGNVLFNYHATDNSGLISNSSSYTIPVSNLSPVSNNVEAPKMLNILGPTAIPGLSSSDAYGTITSYIINSIPPASQGIISIPCGPTPTGATCTGGFADLTAAVLTANPGGIVLTPAQSAALRFDPAAGFNGNTTFNYSAYDNNGNLTNVAAYTIPTGTATVLPLTLINFTGSRSGNDINLLWKTENEINADHFEVEYSIDGISFINGGSVNANNGVVNNYQFTLKNFTQPLYYIRLKSTDKNDMFKYSGIVRIRLNDRLTKAINVTPNPVTESMQIRISSDISAVAEIRITAATGQVVYQTKQLVNKGENAIPVQNIASRLPKGTYAVSMVINGVTVSTKFVL